MVCADLFPSTEGSHLLATFSGLKKYRLNNYSGQRGERGDTNQPGMAMYSSKGDGMSGLQFCSLPPSYLLPEH